MRVIAGTYRSRPLAAPRGSLTRPTSDRLRETLFNILAPRIPGCRFVDLYAGTGAVGIEALSRGAAHVWFAESAPPAIAALRANLRSLAITSGHTVEENGTAALLERLAKSTAAPASAASGRVDVLFLDPPYDAADQYTATLSFLGSPRGLRLLAPDALIIAEHATRVLLPARFGGLAQTRTRKAGDASLTFFAPLAETEPATT